MAYVEGRNREQGTLLPERVEDYVGEDNPVRIIVAFVDSFAFAKLGSNKLTLAETG